jgi:2-polyprenyl-3-methyl-5-hydroxy-6-metoxy-1,4-benzoquinol methylase
MPNKNTKLATQRTEAFDQLYRDKLLGNYETVSGGGATLANSSRMRRGLGEFLSWNINTVLDIGCGDFNWQQTMALDHLRWLAVDIVPEMLEENRRRHQHQNLSFARLDIVTTVPPAHDLVICRDLFTHFNHADTKAALRHIRLSGSQLLAATSYYPHIGHQKMRASYEKSMNSNASSGYWRPVQLQLPPYHLPPPIFSILESSPERALDVWNIVDLPEN